MADKFDPYREALIMETETVWPDAYDHLEAEEKRRIEAALHAEPASCAHLEYQRLHTGFCRIVHVTPADLERVAAVSS